MSDVIIGEAEVQPLQTILEFREPQESEGPGLNFLLYGPPGVGKTTAAASAPGPILYLNTESRNALANARRIYGNDKLREVEWRGDRTITAMEDFIRAHESKIGAVVIDSIGELHKALLNEMVDNKPTADSATLPMFGLANNRIERHVRWLLDRKPVVVLVCHEQMMVDESTGNMIKMPQTGGKQLPQILSAMVDVVGYCGVSVKDGKEAYYTTFRSDGTKYGKDRTGSLGINRISNIERWIEIANTPTIEAAT